MKQEFLREFAKLVRAKAGILREACFGFAGMVHICWSSASPPQQTTGYIPYPVRAPGHHADRHQAHLEQVHTAFRGSLRISFAT